MLSNCRIVSAVVPCSVQAQSVQHAQLHGAISTPASPSCSSLAAVEIEASQAGRAWTRRRWLERRNRLATATTTTQMQPLWSWRKNNVFNPHTSHVVLDFVIDPHEKKVLSASSLIGQFELAEVTEEQKEVIIMRLYGGGDGINKEKYWVYVT